MKLRLLILLLLSAVLGVGWYVLSRPPNAWQNFNRHMSAETQADPAPERPAGLPAPVPLTPPEAPTPGTGQNASAAGSNAGAGFPPDLTPLAALEQTRIAIRLYASMLGENPVGVNFEITRALNGRNSKQVIFVRPEAGMRLNGRGELVDRWDTPYFFHQLSRTEMEIRSAGPDRILWTADDLVVR